MATTTAKRGPRIVRTLLAASLAGVALAGTGCNNRIEVRTLATPDVRIDKKASFRITRRPVQGPTPWLAAYGPMRANSITFAVLSAGIRDAFLAKGYVYAPEGKVVDLDISFYAPSVPGLDARTFYGGYDWTPFPWWAKIDEEAMVLIDAVDPKTRRVLWRGQGTASVSDNPEKFVEQLRDIAEEIVNRFPAAQR
jgi:Domain of unknown function (DUF4136)